MKRLLLLMLFLPMFAFGADFEIQNYQVDIEIHSDQTFDLTETIEVKFFRPRHGIFRTIPYLRFEQPEYTRPPKDLFRLKTHYDTDYLYDFEIPDNKSKIFKNYEEWYIRIGKASKYVDGNQTYTISYKVYGSIDVGEEEAEFYWNVIGHQWDVVTHNAEFYITLPESISEESINYKIFTGEYGSTDQFNEAVYSNGVLSGKIGSLEQYEGITVKMELPDMLFDRKPDPFVRIYAFLERYEIPPRVIWMPVGVFVLLFILWLFFGRDEKFIVVTEFFPPTGMTSADAGKLIDDKTDDRDLISLFYYWAAKRVIHIKEIDNGKDIEIHILKSGYKGQDYENKIFTVLRSNAKKRENEKYPSVRLSQFIGRKALTKAMYEARKIIDSVWEKDPYYHPVSIKIFQTMNLFNNFVTATGLFFIFCFFLAAPAVYIQLGFGVSPVVTGIFYWMVGLIFLALALVFYAIVSEKKPFSKVVTYIALTAISLIVFNLPWIMLIVNYNVRTFLPIPIVSSIISVLIFDFFRRIMPRKMKSGIEKQKVLKGFEEFIRRAEKPALKKLIDENPAYFDETLPYAVAFGLAEEWSRKFEGLIPSSLSWYAPDSDRELSLSQTIRSLTTGIISQHAAFSPARYTPEISSSSSDHGSSGFGSSSSGGFSSSSSSSSGGGFSGGGGGGGGSW